MGNIIDFGPKLDINIEMEIDAMLSNDLAINNVEKLRSSLLGS